MLTLDEIRHIAKLARIRFTEAELQSFSGEFDSILNFVGKLKEPDTSHIKPTTQVSGLESVTRRDDQASGNAVGSSGTREAMLGQAPGRDGDLVRTKAVFE